MESPGENNEFYGNNDAASLDQDPLPYALKHYGLDDLAALEHIDDEGLEAVHLQAAEYVARQFFNQHCPTWTTFLIEALSSCIDYRRAVRVGSLPGDGAGKTRDVVYEYRAVGELDNLWAMRQLLAEPVDAGITPESFVQGRLAPRLRMPITYAQEPATPILICFAKPDPGLSGREDQVQHVFVPKSLAWADGVSRISTLTRSAFATLLQDVREAFVSILEAAPSWNVARVLQDDLDRMHKTTGSAKRPSKKDQAAIQLAMRAVRNLSGTNPVLTMKLAELDYVYRRYEVLR